MNKVSKRQQQGIRSDRSIYESHGQTERTGENFTRGHFTHRQQSFNRGLCLQLCSPLVVNDGLSWSVHLLLKPEEELRLLCHLNDTLSINHTVSFSRAQYIEPPLYLECVAKLETQAGCHHRLVHLNVHL